MLLWLHAALAVLCVVLLARRFVAVRPGSGGRLGISLALAGVMATGLVMLFLAGGLHAARLFGHVMHWLGWLAVLTWAHAVARGHGSGATARVGVPLFLVLAASAAGILALVQDRI
ncbi:hypothetical protein [Geminicoccus roseus]|uniref:hypothetical protein n=1 Tax=Geminicoccus roseus TaxID=404900 RepID=UPI00040C0630|nr:hypothetical protein [Geminicoccus roseus]